MLTMRRTVVAEAVRIWTGLAAPSSTGPISDAATGGGLQQVVRNIGSINIW
jgi:hypothetical protein